MNQPDVLPTAHALLDTFGGFTGYCHGSANPHLSWLRAVPRLEPRQVVDFLNFWYPVSRHQPQILLLCASAFPHQADRRPIIEDNYREEDGLLAAGHSPHYDLLEQLIGKMGGRLQYNPVSEAMITELHCGFLKGLSPAQASGALAGIEHPALDISEYLRLSVARCGFAPLLDSDPYLKIHVQVEPLHILGTHRTALRFMERSQAERQEVLAAFGEVMSFWDRFWARAFAALGEEL